LAVLAVTVGLIAAWGTALWQEDGVQVCGATDNQDYPDIVADGMGGAIIVWEDDRGTADDIYAQRVDGDGEDQWTSDGVVVCNSILYQRKPKIATDGAGGGIVAWEDWRNSSASYYDIYAQKVNASGVAQWTANGVALCNADDDQEDVQIVSDGVGGAIVAWSDERYDDEGGDIFARRVYSDGTVVWATDGVSICVADYRQTDDSICMATDGDQGAIIAWEDRRTADDEDVWDVYAQRVYSNGITAWTQDGISVCALTDSDQEDPAIVDDGAGGAIIVWEDYRVTPDIYAQRLDGNGQKLWQTDGVTICAANGSQYYPEVASDGMGGAIVVWEDHRNGYPNYDIYAQRVDASGNTIWQNNGVIICSETSKQNYPAVIPDGMGGVVVIWWDYRNDSTYQDLYAQRLDANGNTLWMTDGVTVCAASNYQSREVLASDGSGGAIIAWSDNRIMYDIYAQRVNDYHTAVRVPLVMKLD
jgi:hypothetical protein